MQRYQIGSVSRSDVHNASVDEHVAEAGLCGFMHLPRGRTCVLPARHPGSCSFQPHPRARQQAEKVLRRWSGARVLGSR
jgi:hypothetical protein